MHIRYILPALALGGALIASPALARGHGNWQGGGDNTQSSSHQSQNFSRQDPAPRTRESDERMVRSWGSDSNRSSHSNSNNNQNSNNNGNWNNNNSSNDSGRGHNRGDNGNRGNGNQNSGNNSNANANNGDRGHHRGHNWNGNNGNWNNNNSSFDRNRWARDHRGNNSANWNRGNRRHVDRAWFNFRGRNVAGWNSHDRDRWHRGHWRHGNHNGRDGWWWYLNGGWFFYNAPIYPYPSYLSDDVYYDDYYSGGESGYDGDNYDDYQGQPASDGYWYYCRDPEGYYPDVRTCRTDWQKVSPQDRDNYGDRDSGPDNRDGYNEDDDQGSYDDDRN